MQDRERGVVWEEAIIFLPKGIRMVFLSATLSNASEFAGWVCHLHKQPCHVVYTDFRPTPLQHYAFPAGGSGLYLVSPGTPPVMALPPTPSPPSLSTLYSNPVPSIVLQAKTDSFIRELPSRSFYLKCYVVHNAVFLF